MKAYTDLEQSEELAGILPIESADMYYHPYPNDEGWYDIPNIGDADLKYNQLPCWSLAALLDVLPKKYYPVKDHETNLILGKPKDKWCVLYWDTTGMQHREETLGDNPIDACYEMILKLHKLKLL